jgi:hypothetical protein
MHYLSIVHSLFLLILMIRSCCSHDLAQAKTQCGGLMVSPATRTKPCHDFRTRSLMKRADTTRPQESQNLLSTIRTGMS